MNISNNDNEAVELVYAIFSDKDNTPHDYFYTNEEAQTELNSEYENCHIVFIPKSDFYAVRVINKIVDDLNKRQEILEAFYSTENKGIKKFVGEQLSKVCLNKDLKEKYFYYLIAKAYGIGDVSLKHTIKKPIQNFEQYSAEYINYLIYEIFNKKVDVIELLK